MAFNRFTLPFVFAVTEQGVPYENSYMIFFEPDMVTQKTTYADRNLTTPSTTVPVTYNANIYQAVQADASGKFPTIFLTPAEDYYYVFLDQNGVVIDTDNYISTPSENQFSSSQFVTFNGSTYLATKIITVASTTYSMDTETTWGKLIVFSNPNPIAVTLPAPSVSTFVDGWFCRLKNNGKGIVTVTAPSAIIDGVASFTLREGQSAFIASDGSVYKTTPHEGINIKSLTSGANLTIATGVITVTNSYHFVDTEAAAASDDLVTINGGFDGMNLVLRSVSAARNIVVKHNTGNIFCIGGQDITLDLTTDMLVGLYDATLAKWLVYSVGVASFLQSTLVAFANPTTFAHGLGKVPMISEAYAECIGAVDGYSVGDRIRLPGNGYVGGAGGTTAGSSVWADTTNIGVSYYTSLTATVKGGGGAANLLTANWQVRFVYSNF